MKLYTTILLEQPSVYEALLIAQSLNGVTNVSISNKLNDHSCEIRADKFISIAELHTKYPTDLYSFEPLGMTVKVVRKNTNECIGVVLLAHTTKIVLLPYNAKVVLLNANEPKDLEVAVTKKYRPDLWYWKSSLGQFGADVLVMSSTQIDSYIASSWEENPEQDNNVKIIESIKDKVIFVDGWDYSQVYSRVLDTSTGLFEK